MSHPNTAAAWRNVSAAEPCRTCGRPDWCSVSETGWALCRRAGDGAPRVDAVGVAYWITPPAGNASAAARAPAPPRPARRDRPPPSHRRAPEVRAALLAACPLAADDAAALRRRGLGDEDLAAFGSLPADPTARAAVAAGLVARFGEAAVSNTPGFAFDRASNAVRLAAPPGLLVPIRDLVGTLAGLMVRRRAAAPGQGKYLWLSSRAAGGPTSGSPAHVALGRAPGVAGAPQPEVRLTEGALKAEVAARLSDLPTIGIAGLAWRSALGILELLRTRRVRLALDADGRDRPGSPANPAVAAARRAAIDGLRAAGLEVLEERWDGTRAKGIDDALAAGLEIELVDPAADAATPTLAPAPGAAPRPAEPRHATPAERAFARRLALDTNSSARAARALASLANCGLAEQLVECAAAGHPEGTRACVCERASCPYCGPRRAALAAALAAQTWRDGCAVATSDPLPDDSPAAARRERGRLARRLAKAKLYTRHHVLVPGRVAVIVPRADLERLRTVMPRARDVAPESVRAVVHSILSRVPDRLAARLTAGDPGLAADPWLAAGPCVSSTAAARAALPWPSNAAIREAAKAAAAARRGGAPADAPACGCPGGLRYRLIEVASGAELGAQVGQPFRWRAVCNLLRTRDRLRGRPPA